jgi:hypothetical protein
LAFKLLLQGDRSHIFRPDTKPQLPNGDAESNLLVRNVGDYRLGLLFAFKIKLSLSEERLMCKMAITIAIIIIAVALIIAYMLSNGKPRKRKFIVWGVTTMLAIAPLFSWVVSILYAINEGDGFAGVALIALMFPFLFLVGLVILLMGIFKKSKTESI